MSKSVTQIALRVMGYAIWAVGAFIFVSLCIVAPVVLYLFPASWHEWLSGPLGSLLLAASTYVLTTVLILMPFIIRRRPSWSEILGYIGLAKPPKISMIPWAVWCWGIYFVISIVTVLLLSYIQVPGLDLQQEQQIGFANLQYGYEYIAAFLALVVFAPLFEEIILRGYLYGRLRRHSGVVVSTIIVSLAFALIHFQLNVGIDVFILSIFLCFVREKFDSIWPSVYIHAFKNGIAYVLLFILPLYGFNLIQ